MPSELEIYDWKTDSLFKGVIQNHVPEIKKYHVSPDFGADLNTNNLEIFLKDAKFGSASNTEKYPICVCMTPRSRLEKNFERFTFNLFFLQRSLISEIDDDTNQSAHPIIYDWSEMKVAAKKFLNALISELMSDYADSVRWHNVFWLSTIDTIDIKRVSQVGVDKLSGVGIIFIGWFNDYIC